MRRQTHFELGRYLARHYLTGISPSKQHAFLFGCVEPDLNPFTYCKGSFRNEFFRGHNFRNSRAYMERLSNRLHRKTQLGILEYYNLGKLIHYTADAFTYAHQHHYPGSLKNHQAYEAILHNHFADHLQKSLPPFHPIDENIMACIAMLHVDYSQRVPGIFNDTTFILQACSNLMSCLHP